MRILVTGASGYIGNAVAKAFRNGGHSVLGLVRSEEAASSLKQNEIEPIIGDLSKPEIYATAAKNSNVLVHCAFEASQEGIAKDARAIEALIGYARENNLPKVLIYTSGVWVYGKTKGIADESTPLHPIELVKWRPNHEETVLKAASTSLKPIVIRSGVVFGGKGGLTKLWFENPSPTIYGEGANHLPMIHVEDLAALYVAAAEKELGPIVLNAVNQQYPTFKECIEAIASYLKQPVSYLPVEDAKAKFGPLSEGILLDQKISSERAMRLLGWQAKHPDFVQGIQSYFESWKATSY